MKRGKVEIRPSRRSSKSATVINFLKFPMRKPIYLFLVSITVAVSVPFFAISAEKLDAYGYKDLLWKHIVVQSNNRRFEIAELDKIARDFILERDPHFPASNIVAVILIPDISIPDERTNYMAKLHYSQGIGKSFWSVYLSRKGQVTQHQSGIGFEGTSEKEYWPPPFQPLPPLISREPPYPPAERLPLRVEQRGLKK